MRTSRFRRSHFQFFTHKIARNGLSTTEAARRREQYGRNALESSGGVTLRDILIRQVSNSLTAVLAIAMILSYVTLDWIEVCSRTPSLE